MIPKNIIYDTAMNEKRVLLFSYFSLKRGLDDTVGFSCNNIVEWGGYKHNYNKGKINESIKDLLINFIDNKYISIVGDINKNNFIDSVLHTEKFDIDSRFALVYDVELERIRNFKKYTKDITRMSSAILLLVLSYLRVNMLRRQNGYIGRRSDKPEFCYRMYIDIEKDIGISSRYISRAIKILQEMDLIVSHELKRYKDDSENWHTDVTIFVNKYKLKSSVEIDMNYDYTQEIQWGIDYIKEKKFLTKKFYQNTE